MGDTRALMLVLSSRLIFETSFSCVDDTLAFLEKEFCSEDGFEISCFFCASKVIALI